MNTLIECLNLWGARCLHSALPLLLQASLLIVVLFLLDLTFERSARAVVRYGLWLLVLIKLVLPPSLALPTGIGYWLDTRKQLPVKQALPATTVRRFSEAARESEQKFSPPPAASELGFAAFFLLAWIAGSLILVAILICRSRKIARRVAEAVEAPAQLHELLNSCCRQMGIRQPIALKLAGFAMSPAACGLLRPVILIPEELVNKLSMVSLRAVLLHELAHIKRGDVWVNYLQTLLQIVYWYHPLLWLANAQIRRVREQAVDEMVMVEMGEDAETYPATLLQVAKTCFARAKLSLGLVGIVESGSALAQRLRRLVNRPIPATSRLTMANVLVCLLVGAVLLPMAHGQRNDKQLSSDNKAIDAAKAANLQSANGITNPKPRVVTVDAKFLALSGPAFQTTELGAPNSTDRNGISIWSLSSEQLEAFLRRVEKQPGLQILSAPRIETADGQEATVYTGQVTQGAISGDAQRTAEPIEESGGPIFSVNAIGYVNVHGTNNEGLSASSLIGPALKVFPRVIDNSIDVVINAQVTEAVLNNDHGNKRATPAARPEVRTNFLAEARVLIPSRGTAVIANRNSWDAKGTNVLLLISTTLSEADSPE